MSVYKEDFKIGPGYIKIIIIIIIGKPRLKVQPKPLNALARELR